MEMDKRRAGGGLLAAALAIGLCAAAFVSAQTARTVGRGTGGQVVATVNGEKILRDEVAEQLLREQTARLSVTNPQFMDRQRQVAASVGALVLKKLAASGGRSATVTRSEIIDWFFKDKPLILTQTVERMIQERVIRQEARKRGINPTQADFDARYAEEMGKARQALSLGGMNDRQLLSTVGFLPETLKRNVQTTLLLERIVQKDLETKLGHPVGPDDFVDASHILVRAFGNDEAARNKAFEDALAKIKGYAADISAGKMTFEDAALKHSDDTSKLKKGALGVFLRGQMVPEFDAVAFSAEPGKISEPVKTQFGYHLIKVNRRGKDTTPAERKLALESHVRTRMQQAVMQLMQTAKVSNTVAQAPMPMMTPRPGAPPQVR